MQLSVVIMFLMLFPRFQADGINGQRSWDHVRSLRVVTQASGINGDGQTSRLYAEVRISNEGALYFENAHGDEASRLFDLNRTRLYLREGIVTEEIPSRRVVVEYPFKRSAIDRVERYPIWAVLGWWPEDFPSSCPMVHEAPTRLLLSTEAAGPPETEEAKETITVRTPRELIELSRSHGLAIARRTWFTLDSSRPLTTMVVDEFFEIAPDVWFPRIFRVLRHNPNQSDEVRTVTFEVIEARIDDLNPSDFTFDPLPGTYLVDADGNGGGRQIAPGGFDLMRSFVRLIRSTNTPSVERNYVQLFGALSGIIAFLVVARYVRPRFQ